MATSSTRILHEILAPYFFAFMRGGKHDWLLRIEPWSRHLPFTDGGTRALGHILKAYILRDAKQFEEEAKCLEEACKCPLPNTLRAECEYGLALIESRRRNVPEARRHLANVFKCSLADTGQVAAILIKGDLMAQRVAAHDLSADLAFEADPETAEIHAKQAIELKPDRPEGWQRATALYRRHPTRRGSNVAANLFLFHLDSGGPAFLAFATDVGPHLRPLTAAELKKYICPHLCKTLRSRPGTWMETDLNALDPTFMGIVTKSIPDASDTRLARCTMALMSGGPIPSDVPDREATAARHILRVNFRRPVVLALFLEPLFGGFRSLSGIAEEALLTGYGGGDSEAKDAAGCEVIRAAMTRISQGNTQFAIDVWRWIQSFCGVFGSDEVGRLVAKVGAVMNVILEALRALDRIPEKALWGLEGLGIQPVIGVRVERALLGIVMRVGTPGCQSLGGSSSCGDPRQCSQSSVSCECLSESVQMAMAETSLQIKVPSLAAVAIAAQALDRPLIAEQCILAARLRAQLFTSDHQQVSTAGMLVQMLRPYLSDAAREIAFSVEYTWNRYRGSDIGRSDGPNKYMAYVVWNCMRELGI